MDDGTVIAEISYEDVNGNVTTEQKEFELFVTEPVDMGYDDMYTEELPAEEPQGLLDQLRQYIAYIAIAAVVLVIVLVAVVKRHRKKKLERELEIKENEDEEDEY